ncbi:MAG: flagellar protein FliT [Bacillota bacterium]|uniref:flagellar protein FliT n=1 Tax=unclassified Candidatus Desulforudis TaxID=2635950 RepID=UPI003477ECAF
MMSVADDCTKQPADLWTRLFVLTEKIGAVLDGPDGEIDTKAMGELLEERRECMDALDRLAALGIRPVIDDSFQELIRQIIDLDRENQRKAEKLLAGTNRKLHEVRQSRKAVRAYGSRRRRDEGVFLDDKK